MKAVNNIEQNYDQSLPTFELLCADKHAEATVDITNSQRW